MRERISSIDWQVDCRQAPCRWNKLSLSSSITVSTSTPGSPQALSESPQASMYLPHFPKVSTAWWGGRGRRLHWSISCPPPGALIEKFGWPCLFVLVDCGGLCFFLGFSSVPLLRRLRGESSDGGQAKPCLQSATSLSPPSALRGLPHLVASSPADRRAGPLVFTVRFLWPSQTWTDRQQSSGLGNQVTARRDKLKTNAVRSKKVSGLFKQVHCTVKQFETKWM